MKLKYEFRLYEYYATASIPDDAISLRNGLTCAFSKGSCIDSLEGSVTWDTSVTPECVKSEYTVLFTGYVNKTYDASGTIDRELAIYSTQQTSGLFSIRAFDKTDACGHTVWRTDHPKIFIYEVENNHIVFTNKMTGGKDLDIFTYFNSKVNMLESHIQRQLERLYDDLYQDICKLEQKVLGTQLILAKIYPNDFATDLMRQDGYTAVVAGEVIYLIQCKPVYVILERSDACYHEIPVKLGTTTMYMTPMTRILQKEGNQVECSPFLASKYKFGDKWYTIDGRIREAPSPEVLRSDMKANWTYTHIPDLMKSGIYTRDQIEQMKTVIYDTSMQRSATTYLKHMLEGKDVRSHAFDVRHMLPDSVVESAVQRYWMRFLGFASWLGHLTTAIIGFYMIAKIVKFLIDTVIHGKILYDLYGLGWQLIAAFWDSLTTFFTHRAMDKRSPRARLSRPEAVPAEIIEMEEQHNPPVESTSLYPTLPSAPSIPSLAPKSRPKYDP